MAAVGLGHVEVAAQGLYALARGDDGIVALVLGGIQLVADIDVGRLRGVDSGHHDLRLELRAAHDVARIGYDECRELVDAHVAAVDALHKRREGAALGVEHVALHLRQDGDGSADGDVLEERRLPRHLPADARRGAGREIALDDLGVALGHVTHQGVAILLDAVAQHLPRVRHRREHHEVDGLEVLAVLDVVHIAVLAVGLAHDEHLERVDVII